MQTNYKFAKLSAEDARLKELALAVLDIEAHAILSLRDRIDGSFLHACKLILAVKGRVVVTGIGKSGHIGKKLAATLASTGTPSFFMHPAEALHGDLGMLTKEDLVVALSYSGEAEELNVLLPVIKRLGVPLVSFTGNIQSTLAKYSEVTLDASVIQEACPLGLAPTASSTAMLAFGDALAIALLEARGFTKEDFAKSHPGGRLGRRLLVKIADIMHTGADVPVVATGSLLADALLEMSAKRLGFTVIASEVVHPHKEQILGVFTDGDLRRALSSRIDIQTIVIDTVMTKNFSFIYSDSLAIEAVTLMETKKINAIPVYNGQDVLVGALNMHDLFRAGVV